jgi:hypothetical protein
MSLTGAATLSNTINVAGIATFSNSITAASLTTNTSASIGTNLTVSGNGTIANILTVSNSAVISNNLTSESIIFDNAALFSNTRTTTTVGASEKIIFDQYPLTQGNFSKHVITVRSGTNYHAIEMLLIYTGSSVLVTKYAELFNTKLGTFDADIGTGANSALLDVSFTANTIGTYTVKTLRQQFLA